LPRDSAPTLSWRAFLFSQLCFWNLPSSAKL
jgi:hypothetical protein